MCTAITYQTKDFYFGRTLDYDRAFGEAVTLTPRNFPLPFRHISDQPHHYAILGMAHTADGYPLYYDAFNEHGLAMAGLNFVGNAVFAPPVSNRENIAVFELIPWILGNCRNTQDARKLLCNCNLTNTSFSASIPTAQLHWLLADKQETITLEATADGLQIHDNPVGVLTNNPPFPQQLTNLCNYCQLSPDDPENRLLPRLTLQPYSRGMGAIGLPGDLSSQSRFVRAAFTRYHSVTNIDADDSVSQFFHILGTVSQTRGCCRIDQEAMEITIYTACCNTDRGIYYYTTYGNRQITAVNMHHEDINDNRLIHFPLVSGEHIYRQN